MKVREALDLLRNAPKDKLFGELSDLFLEEGKRRVALRAHDKKPSQNLIKGVTDEMKKWIAQVAQKLSLPKDQLNLLLKTAHGALFVEYGLMDPQITNAQRRVKQAALEGKLPIEVLNNEDLDALTSKLFKEMSKKFSKM